MTNSADIKKGGGLCWVNEKIDIAQGRVFIAAA